MRPSSQLPLSNIRWWWPVFAILALTIILAFTACICWMFLAFGQQQILAQVMASITTLFTTFAGLGFWNWWQRVRTP